MNTRVSFRVRIALIAALVAVIPRLQAGTFAVAPLTGDADATVTPDSAFTHAFNINDTGNLRVNGAIFTGSGSGTNPTTNNYSTTGLAAAYTGFASPVSGVIGSGLMTNFLYNGNPATVTLKNLRVGQQYETVFYNAAFGGPGGRVQNITASDGGAIVFDQNGQPGSLLRYGFTASSNSLVFTFSPQSAATFHHYGFSNRVIGAQALLTDNFYAPSNPTTTDLNFNLASRQGGQIVASKGTVPWTAAGNTQVGNNTGGVDGGNYLLTAFTTGIAALDHNFNDAESAGGLSISFDLAPDIGAAGNGGWCAINLGQGVSDKLGPVNGTQPHFGVLFRGSTGTLQAFDGSTVVSPTPEPLWNSTSVTNQLHHIELLITDSGDGNPFDGAGETRIEIYANGILRYTYTKAGGGYADNHVNFQSNGIGGIDNLVVSRLSTTPAPPVFVDQPQSQSLWRGDRLTLSAAVSAYPAATYQWYLNGVAIDGATSSSYITTSNASGNYTVVATNSRGSTMSEEAKVDVIALTRAQRTWEGLGPSSRRTGLVISEIHYHPPTRADGRNVEFVELYNSNPWVEDIAGWQLTDDIDFTFPAGAQIGAKGYIVVAKVPADVQAVYGIAGVFGGFSQNFSNEGGTIRLQKPSGAVVLEASWNDRMPWPVAPDGTGHSLVLARPSYGEASAEAWDSSASIGGSPGTSDTPPGEVENHVVINEVLTRSDAPLVDFIELRNDAPTEVDISGCTLSDDPEALRKFIIPGNTTLAPGATISFTETQLGFALSAEGETLYFANAEGSRVLDSVRFGGSVANVSLGRASDRGGAFRALSAVTRGAANSAARTPDVLISEIFYDPISGDDLDEWLELYNPSTSSVDISGWQLADGVSFTMPAGTIIGPRARMVVAKNSARMRANHPELNPSLIVGNYIGTLANRGERITLIRPEAAGSSSIPVEVDIVIYRKAGRWSRWAAGGGSSLEVIDLHADRTFASNWADSDESAKASWSDVVATGVLDLGHSAVSGANRVQVFLMGEGEALVDNVTVTGSGGGNSVANSGFESGLSGWILQGNHSRSSVVSDAGFGGGAALQVRASEDGEPDGNRIYAALTTTLAANSSGTISAKARWLRGSPELLLRLRGGYLETLSKLNVPSNLGTPGAVNSRELANAGPAISDVSHRPLLPPIGVPIRVFARVADPDGIASALLRWRVDTNPNFTNVSMRDDGADGDIFAGDGVYTGSIPAQNAATLVVFRVESEDAAATRVKAIFPPDAPAHECLVRIGDPAQGGDFSSYRMWITGANVTAWANRPKFGNEPVDSTFVYGNARAVYGCGAWYSGSEASTPGYNSPIGNLCGYNLILPPDDTVLGEDHFTIDFPIRDATDQREQLMYWMAEQLRLPNLYRRYVHLFINGTRRGTIYDDVQQPDQGFLDEFFPDDPDGHLYKTNNWNEGADDANSTSAGVDNILRHYDSGGQHKLARYRWNWRPRSAQSANEFNDLFTLIDAVNTSTNYRIAVESIVDVENWMRTFAFHDLCSYWDAFGNPNHKNTYLYKPQAGRWVQITWDMDVGLGVFNDPTNAPLFPATVDTKVDALQAFAPFRRIYWRTVHEALATFFSGSTVTPQLQRKYNALAANGIGLTSPFVASGAYGLSVTQWIDQRRAFLQTQLNTVNATFAITSPANVAVTTPTATITGTAPVNVKTLTVNDVALPVEWSSVTAWRITFVPAAGSHPYVIRALNSSGVQVGTGAVTIDFTGANPWPLLRINEWMASNDGAVTDPADGRADDWLELFNPTAVAVDMTNWRLRDSSNTPTEFVFPAGYSIPPGGHLLAWCDEETVQNAPPTSLHLPFKLSASGETLTLTAPDGTVVDTVTFGQQVSNVSQGRVPDGGASVEFLTTASAGTVNANAITSGVATLTSGVAGSVVITTNTTPGFTYQLQAKDNLTDEAWTNLGPPLTATTISLTFSDQIDGRSQRFYRVVRTP